MGDNKLMMKYKIFLPLIALVILCGSSVMYQAIRHDDTLIGDGTTASPLGVNRGGTIEPSQITAHQTNYNPTQWDDATMVRLDASDMWMINSMAAPTTSTKPQRKTIVNMGDSTIIFTATDAGTAANRIILPRDFKLYPKTSCEIAYDDTASRWRILSAEDENGRTGVFYEWSASSITAGDNNQMLGTAIGTGTITATASTTVYPGRSELSTSTNAAWGYIMSFSKNLNGYSAFGSAHNYVEALVSIPTLSDGSNTFTAEVQITNSHTSTTLENNNAIGIRYSDGINGGEWELFSQDNSAGEDVADSGVAVAAATLYKLRIEIDKSNTEARGYINDVYIGKVESNMPNAVILGSRVILLKSVGTTARTLNVHSFSAGAIYK